MKAINYVGLLAAILWAGIIVCLAMHIDIPEQLWATAVSAAGVALGLKAKEETVSTLVNANLAAGVSPSEVINKWLPFPRCWSHIVLAIICGSIWVLGIPAAILAGILAYLFVSYERQQDKNCLTQSYLDIREFAVTVTITILVVLGLRFMGIIPCQLTLL